jgi:hypothetical protein
LGPEKNCDLHILIEIFLNQLRDLVIPSINQLSHHDSVSNVIKMAIQRGMGITQIKRQSSGNSSTVINDNINIII